ncbi:hypothetical protein BS50DRAFT_291262 [Corynespora cassiicola Philippines]|uniref:Secreted protein n=1 Tax=Corynespora cassiicola Philippines TaxID=1448308 RepID=A0A2T2NVW9_CORCC|nr:hypothetical protein BS50DRAFT_291262 [Corynespora cassiicola Philippines]
MHSCMRPWPRLSLSAPILWVVAIVAERPPRSFPITCQELSSSASCVFLGPGCRSSSDLLQRLCKGRQIAVEASDGGRVNLACSIHQSIR